MIQLNTLNSSIKNTYYLEDGKFYNYWFSPPREVEVDKMNRVRLSTSDGGRRYFDAASLLRQSEQRLLFKHGAYRISFKSLQNAPNLIEYFYLYEICLDNCASLESKINRFNDRFGQSNNDLINRIIEHYEEITGELKLSQYSGEVYIETTSEVLNSLYPSVNRIKIYLLWKLWSRNGFQRLSYNTKQIASALSINYSDGKKREILSLDLRFMENEFLFNIETAQRFGDGYSYNQIEASFTHEVGAAKVFRLAKELSNELTNEQRENEEFMKKIVEIIQV